MKAGREKKRADNKTLQKASRLKSVGLFSSTAENMMLDVAACT